MDKLPKISGVNHIQILKILTRSSVSQNIIFEIIQWYNHFILQHPKQEIFEDTKMGNAPHSKMKYRLQQMIHQRFYPKVGHNS